MPKQDWKNNNCPWNCSECAKREEQRDLALAVKPFYTEHIKPFKNQVMEMRVGSLEDDLSDVIAVCLLLEKTKFSSTKAKPAPLLTFLISWWVRLAYGEYIDYRDKPMNYSYILVSGEIVDGWLKMEVKDSDYGMYSSMSKCLWLKPWDFPTQPLEIVPRKGWKCPDCGVFGTDQGCSIIAPDEETGEMETQFWCNCGFKRSLNKMGEYEALQSIPEDLQEYIVPDMEAEMEQCEL